MKTPLFFPTHTQSFCRPVRRQRQSLPLLAFSPAQTTNAKAKFLSPLPSTHTPPHPSLHPVIAVAAVSVNFFLLSNINSKSYRVTSSSSFSSFPTSPGHRDPAVSALTTFTYTKTRAIMSIRLVNLKSSSSRSQRERERERHYLKVQSYLQLESSIIVSHRCPNCCCRWINQSRLFRSVCVCVFVYVIGGSTHEEEEEEEAFTTQQHTREQQQKLLRRS